MCRRLKALCDTHAELLGLSVETLVEGLPGRRFIRRLFVTKNGDMRRPGDDQKEDGVRTTVRLVPLGFISLVQLRFRRAVGPSRMGLRSGAKRFTAFRSFVFNVRENPGAPRWSYRRPACGGARSSTIPPLLKARLTLTGAVRFLAHVRRPESLKRVGAPEKDTVQCYTRVGLVQVAAP